METVRSATCMEHEPTSKDIKSSMNKTLDYSIFGFGTPFGICGKERSGIWIDILYICKKYRMVLDDITIKPVSTMHMNARITSASRQPGQPVGKVLRNLSADVGQGVCTSERGASVQLWN